MRKGYIQIEGEFYNIINPLVNSKVRLKRGSNTYEGEVKKESHRFYLEYDGKKIKIKPSDDIIKIGKLEKKAA